MTLKSRLAAAAAAVALTLVAAAPAMAEPVYHSEPVRVDPRTGLPLPQPPKPAPVEDMFLSDLKAGTLRQEDYDALKQQALSEFDAAMQKYKRRMNQLGYEVGEQGGQLADVSTTLAGQGGIANASIADVMNAGINALPAATVIEVGATNLAQEMFTDIGAIAGHLVEARSHMQGGDPATAAAQLHAISNATVAVNQALYQHVQAVNEARTAAQNMTPDQVAAAAGIIQHNIDAGVVIRQPDGTFIAGPNAPTPYVRPGAPPSSTGPSVTPAPSTPEPAPGTTTTRPRRPTVIPGHEPVDGSIYVDRRGPHVDPAPQPSPTPQTSPTPRTAPTPAPAPPPVILIRIPPPSEGVFQRNPNEIPLPPGYRHLPLPLVGDPEWDAANSAMTPEMWAELGQGYGQQLDPADLAYLSSLLGNGGLQLPGSVTDGQWQPGDAWALAFVAPYNGRGESYQGFEDGGWVIVANLDAIYAGYDINGMPLGSSGRSLSSAGTSGSAVGNSLSAAGWSLSAVGWSLSSAGWSLSSLGNSPLMDWNGIALASNLFGIAGHAGVDDLWLTFPTSLGEDAWMGRAFGWPNPWAYQPWSEVSEDLVRGLYGPLSSDTPYEIQRARLGDNAFSNSGVELGNLNGSGAWDMMAALFGGYNFGFNDSLQALLQQLGLQSYLSTMLIGGQGGLDQILAQPFNVILTWGAGAYDLDLHLTGPTGGLAPNAGPTDRWHIYYAARGSQAAFPFAELIRDCVCTAGSEVIQTSALIGGGVYRVSVFNFGDQSATSSNLAAQSDAVIQIVRGGQVQNQGQGTTIVGGRTIVSRHVPTVGEGNTWVAIEIDPDTGRIRAPDTIVQSNGSTDVH